MSTPAANGTGDPDASQPAATSDFPTKRLTVAIGFTAVFLLISSWNDWQSFRHFRGLLTQEFRLQQLSGVITHLDEVLTMSARQAAATGDPKWEQRYREADPKLEAAIKEARQLAQDPLIERAITDTDSANAALVALEHRAFGLAREGQLKAAAAVLDSAEYDQFKKAYSGGLNRIIAAFTAQAQERLVREQRVMFSIVAAGFLGLSVLLVSWIAVLRAGRRYLSERERVQDDLRRAYAGVETQVRERTRDLVQAHRELVEVSRQAGMAEVATSVLHNVGNVLNRVSVSAEVVAGKVRQSKAGGLKAVATLLREHAHDLPAFLAHDPRGKELPGYLLKLIEHLAEPQPGILQELEMLRKNIEHIKEIVATQQRHARGSGVMETLSVTELVVEALSINAAGFGRHGVELIKELPPLPPLLTDRHKVLQILVNLVNNAKHALGKVAGEKRLIVRATLHETEGVRIAVIDNGVGIAPENLGRIFQHGFTTKKDGHGFGLHSGALAAKELGGRLTVHSDGLGHGAVFTLELPLQNKKELR